MPGRLAEVVKASSVASATASGRKSWTPNSARPRRPAVSCAATKTAGLGTRSPSQLPMTLPAIAPSATIDSAGATAVADSVYARIRNTGRQIVTIMNDERREARRDGGSEGQQATARQREHDHRSPSEPVGEQAGKGRAERLGNRRDDRQDAGLSEREAKIASDVQEQGADHRHRRDDAHDDRRGERERSPADVRLFTGSAHGARLLTATGIVDQQAQRAARRIVLKVVPAALKARRRGKKSEHGGLVGRQGAVLAAIRFERRPDGAERGHVGGQLGAVQWPLILSRLHGGRRGHHVLVQERAREGDDHEDDQDLDQAEAAIHWPNCTPARWSRPRADATP